MSIEDQKRQEKPELLFSDLPVGRMFRPLKYPITEELVRNYMETIGDFHPLYWNEAYCKDRTLGTCLAPPGLAAIYARLSYLQDHSMPSGGILAKQEFEFKGPIRLGDTLRVKAKIMESYLDEKKRKRVTFLVDAENQNLDPVSVIRLFAIWPK